MLPPLSFRADQDSVKASLTSDVRRSACEAGAGTRPGGSARPLRPRPDAPGPRRRRGPRGPPRRRPTLHLGWVTGALGHDAGDRAMSAHDTARGGQPEPEARASAGFALHPDAPAVRLDQALDDGKSRTRAFIEFPASARVLRRRNALARMVRACRWLPMGDARSTRRHGAPSPEEVKRCSSADM